MASRICLPSFWRNVLALLSGRNIEAVGLSEISTRIHDVSSQKAVFLKRRTCFEDLGFDWKVILNSFLTKYSLGV
jgi:hypothetical protein